MKVTFWFVTACIACVACNNNKNKKATPVTQKEEAPAKKILPTAAMQIKLAVLAAPEEKRDSCTVYGYDADTQLVTLRKGTNEMICLGDDPRSPGFSVACYSQELEPFMARGRELRKEGMTEKQIFDERGKEVSEGTLKMPKDPSALYVYTAKAEDVNYDSAKVKNGYLRYVIYIPFATAASTGLPEKPSAPGMPWIMNPGTYRAHIMIDP
jgi:hypothetical protein